MKIELKRLVRYHYLRFIRLQGDPHPLAMGVAIGVFIGISPTLPLHTVMIISITLLMRVSTVSAIIAAAVVSNPLTFVPQYYLSWLAGDFIMPGKLTWERMEHALAAVMEQGFREGLETVIHLGLDAIMVMLVGGCLLGILPAIGSYFLSYRFFQKLEEKRRRRRSKK
ncbi:MAG: DUF2062 domain-containing protein [Desulfobulbaceae bacterium]|nr:DUF2062 domain-containing protein [Desulfobulbaceae bacterium]